MPNLPPIYGRKAYTNQQGVGQASGQITQNLVRDEQKGAAIRRLGAILSDIGQTAQAQIQRNQLTAEKDGMQQAKGVAKEVMNSYQQDLLEGRKLQVPIEMSMSSGGFVYQQAMEKLGVDREDNSRMAEVKRRAVRQTLAPEYINFYNLRTEQLRLTQEGNVYKIVEREKTDLNFGNFGEKMMRVAGAVNDLGWATKQKIDYMKKKTPAFRRRAMDHEITTYAAFVLNKEMSLQQKTSMLLAYKDDIKAGLTRTESMYSGIEDTETIYKQGEAKIDSIIERMGEQEELKDGLIEEHRRDFKGDFEYDFNRTYTDEADFVLSNTGIDERWSERVQSGKEKISMRGSLASPATGGVDPGAYNFETDMGKLSNELYIGFTEIDAQTGQVSLSPEAEKMISENPELAPYLDIINQNPLQNPVVQRAYAKASSEKKQELDSRFHGVNVGGSIELRYKSFLDAMIMNGKKHVYLQAFEGKDYAKEQKRRDDMIVGRSITSMDSGLYSVAQTKRRLLWRAQNSDLSSRGYERALGIIKKRQVKEKRESVKLPEVLSSSLKGFGKQFMNVLDGELNRHYNSNPSLSMRRQIISQTTGAYIPHDSRVNLKRAQIEQAYSYRLGIMKERMKGMNVQQGLRYAKKEKAKMISELRRGGFYDVETGQNIKMRDIAESEARANFDQYSDDEIVAFYKDPLIIKTPEVMAEMERRISERYIQEADKMEAGKDENK